MGLSMKTTLTILYVLSLTISVSVSAESAQSATPKVPPLHDCELTEQRDLGVWDDVFVCDDQGMIVLRRGEALFSLSMTGSADPTELAKASVLAKTQIVASVGSDDKLWLFMQGGDTAPFAIDAYSGRLSKFDIPGLKIPGKHAPGIQSHVVVQHAGGVILMIAGGDRDTWPRDGNRPVYFWMSLRSGKVVRFPIGWDLYYFSGNQRVAIFEKPQEQCFQRHPLQAVDVETGGYVEKIPDQRKERYVLFNWTETQSVKPFYVRRAETGDRDHFAGISLKGHMYPFDAKLNGVYYLSTAKTREGFVGFRLRREGNAGGEPSSFWLMGLKQHESPQLVATGVTSFAMLDQGNCVFATFGHGPKEESSEAFFRSYSGKFTWNILDGVKRLPELDEQFTDKDYVEDRMTVRLIDGFGNHDSLALCLFSHFRGDLRAFALTDDVSKMQDKRVEWITWRRAVILTSDGERHMTSLFREGNVPDLIWLHNSGKLIVGNYLWRNSSSSTSRERQIQLREITLGLQQKRK